MAAGAVSAAGGADRVRSVRGGLDRTSRDRDGSGRVSLARARSGRGAGAELAPCIMGGMLAELARCCIRGDIVEVARQPSGVCEEHRIHFLVGQTRAAFRWRVLILQAIHRLHLIIVSNIGEPIEATRRLASVPDELQPLLIGIDGRILLEHASFEGRLMM